MKISLDFVKIKFKDNHQKNRNRLESLQNFFGAFGRKKNSMRKISINPKVDKKGKEMEHRTGQKQHKIRRQK